MFQAQDFRCLHTQLPADHRFRPAFIQHFENHGGHAIDGVFPPGAVVSDGGSHPVIDRLVDHDNRQPSMVAFKDVLVCLAGVIAVKAIDDFIDIAGFVVDSDHRLCVAVVMD